MAVLDPEAAFGATAGKVSGFSLHAGVAKRSFDSFQGAWHVSKETSHGTVAQC